MNFYFLPNRCVFCLGDKAVVRGTCNYRGTHTYYDLCRACAKALEFEEEAIATRAALHLVSLKRQHKCDYCEELRPQRFAARHHLYPWFQAQ